jgi:hypothetical protein
MVLVNDSRRGLPAAAVAGPVLKREVHLIQSNKLGSCANARKFGAHASFVSKIESDERRIDVVELADLCRVDGIALAAFLRDAGIAISWRHSNVA